MLMVVMTPREARETWTDQRLDDLNAKVDKGFADVDSRFGRLEARVDKGFADVDKDIRELRGDINDLKKEMTTRFESLDHKLIGAAVVVIAALIGSNATLIGIGLL